MGKVVLNGKTYTIEQLYNKTIMSEGHLPYYSYTGQKVPKGYIEKGQAVGVVYGHTEAKNGNPAFLMLDSAPGSYLNETRFIALSSNGSIDFDSLEQQGVKDDKTLLQEQEKGNDMFMYYFKKLALPVGLFVGVLTVTVTGVKSFLSR